MNVQIRRLVLAAAAIALTATAASAQAKKEQGDKLLVGPNIEYGTNHVKFGIGAHLSYPIINRVDILPQFDYYFPGNSVHLWTLEGAVRYWPKLNMKNPGLYGAAGLNISHTSVSNFGSSTDVGLGLTGGWMFKQVPNLLPHVQIRVVVGNADRVEFGGGVNFKL